MICRYKIALAGIVRWMDNSPFTACVSMLYSKANVINSLMDKIAAKCAIPQKPDVQEVTGRSVDELQAALNAIKNFM